MKKRIILVMTVFLFLGCNIYKDVDGFAINIEFKEITSTSVKIQWSDNMERLITDKADPLLALVTVDFYRSGGHSIPPDVFIHPAYEYNVWISEVSTDESLESLRIYSPTGIDPESNEAYKFIPFYEAEVDSLKPNTLYDVVILYHFSTYLGIPPNSDGSPGILGLEPYLMSDRRKIPFRTLPK